MDLLAKKISIIIPAYNEEEAIGGTLAALQALKLAGEIIVVDDGSSDRTAELARAGEARVISHEVNRGYGASLKTGIKNAKYDIIGFLDADGQQDPCDLQELNKYIGEFDMVVGARTSQANIPLWRRPGKFLISRLANYLAGRKIPDFNSGLRLIKKEVILPYIKMFPDGFSFSTTSTIFFIKEGLKIKYVPIQVQKRKGKSTLTARHGLDTIILVLRLITMFEPLKIFLPASFVIFIFGLAWAVSEYVLFHKLGAVSIVLGVAALLVFFVGLISDQIANLRKELK
jgi:glycosyltransferase involved in cell wall biosynthesis